MPVKRKSFIFKDFGYRLTIFEEQAFSEKQLSPNQLLLNTQLTKIKSQNINVIGDKICIKSKILKSKSKLVKL